jgi:mannose-6-phosphate isomerase-like protein (cupin superfamily)
MIASPLAGTTLGADGGQFIVAEWRDAGGSPGQKRLIAPFHVHHADDEAWYVLEGTLIFRVGNEEIEARAGSGVLVQRGKAHTYWNPLAEPARYVIIMTPTIHGLIRAIHAMPVRTREALSAIFEEHNSALLPDPE